MGSRPSATLNFHTMLYALGALRILGAYIRHTMASFNSPKFSGLGGLILVLGLLFDLNSVQGVEITPFSTQNQSPLVMIYGLPSIGEPSLVPVGKVEGRFTLDFANNFVEISKDQPGGEEIVLDGESTRVTLDIRYGAARRMELGIQIPYITVNGGFLDSFVEGFHSAIGAGREFGPWNRGIASCTIMKKTGRSSLIVATPSRAWGISG